MTNERRVLVHPDPQALTGAVAARFITKVIDLLDEKPEVHVVLTGGRVGTGILASINESEARDSIDWARVHIWWGDERWVSADDEERNDVGAQSALLDNVGLLPEHVHRYGSTDHGEDLDAAASAYSAELQRVGDGADFPVFDITFLGVGPDGHIASLFPNSPTLTEEVRTVVPVRSSPKPPAERLSMTLRVINSSDRIWMSLTGADKASALGLALAGASYVDVPAAGARGRKRTVFFVDVAAAAEVPESLISREY